MHNLRNERLIPLSRHAILRTRAPPITFALNCGVIGSDTSQSPRSAHLKSWMVQDCGVLA